MKPMITIQVQDGAEDVWEGRGQEKRRSSITGNFFLSLVFINVLPFFSILLKKLFVKKLVCARVAELGSLSSGAKMAMKIFVKRVFTIFASNASFLRVIANLQN